ncbi:UNVERIFIED_CONTAM: hypothetical protein Slati_4207300 [Sesamum latifolium]|uniref:Uncharacterized protein n=1 Tax=Sesamum latifolium TaxID=2727402 RepID=A0AAW2TAF2_9LAMI
MSKMLSRLSFFKLRVQERAKACSEGVFPSRNMCTASTGSIKSSNPSRLSSKPLTKAARGT